MTMAPGPTQLLAQAQWKSNRRHPKLTAVTKGKPKKSTMIEEVEYGNHCDLAEPIAQSGTAQIIIKGCPIEGRNKNLFNIAHWAK